jgi:hypothetical protein
MVLYKLIYAKRLWIKYSALIARSLYKIHHHPQTHYYTITDIQLGVRGVVINPRVITEKLIGITNVWIVANYPAEFTTLLVLGESCIWQRQVIKSDYITCFSDVVLLNLKLPLLYKPSSDILVSLFITKKYNQTSQSHMPVYKFSSKSISYFLKLIITYELYTRHIASRKLTIPIAPACVLADIPGINEKDKIVSITYFDGVAAILVTNITSQASPFQSHP